ncbi:MAG: hypothetical protein HWE39_11315 [Oceanospirillaceae bacterium]|nr:hypothetical protein [Oceanospirillaceae bacterium]
MLLARHIQMGLCDGAQDASSLVTSQGTPSKVAGFHKKPACDGTATSRIGTVRAGVITERVRTTNATTVSGIATLLEPGGKAE